MNQNIRAAVFQALGPWKRGTQVEAYRQQCCKRFEALPPAQQASIIEAGKSLLSRQQPHWCEFSEAVLVICMASQPAALPSEGRERAISILRASSFRPWKELAETL